jgi:hypothetical protein
MRPARAAVLVAGAALLAAGCGERAAHDQTAPDRGAPSREQPSPPPPVGSGYSESLAALCTRTHTAHDAVGIATSPDELSRKLPRTTAIDRRFLAELGRLVPPAPLVNEAGALLRLFGIVNTNEQVALTHLRLHNWNGYFQYMDTALAVRLETDRIVRRLGAPACTFRPFRGA